MVNTKVFLLKIKKEIAKGNLSKAKARKMIQGKRASVNAKKSLSEKDLRLINSFSKRLFKKKKSFTLI